MLPMPRRAALMSTALSKTNPRDVSLRMSIAASTSAGYSLNPDWLSLMR
jgi:hypothetical protein